MEKHYKQLFEQNIDKHNFLYTNNNTVQFYYNGEDKFQALINDIKLARKYIHLQYYIIRNDELWAFILEMLIEKAKSGVTIRVLFDGLGSIGVRHSDIQNLPNVFLQPFYKPGIAHLYKKLNYRNHRKIAVIDGHIAYLGGFNIGLEYLGLDEYFGEWRDTHMRMTGSCVNSLNLRFSDDWQRASGELLSGKVYYPQPVILGDVGCQILTSSPKHDKLAIRDNFVGMINLARESVYIETPYFIPDRLLLDAIEDACSRGVIIKVVIPEGPDHPFVYWGTTYFMGKLLSRNVQFFVYNKGFLHSKFVVVDGVLSTIGTANFDMRSFTLNYEVNALIYSRLVAQKLTLAFFDDIRHSTLVTSYMYHHRSKKVKTKEYFCKLIAPLM